MSDKKAQGLPLSFIVIAAISVLILVLIVAFTVGAGGGFLRQLIAPAPAEIESIQTACSAACDRISGITSEAQFKSSDYCSKTFTADIDRDGKINATSESGLHCWDNAIGQSCALTTTTGITLTQDALGPTDTKGYKKIGNCCNYKYNASATPSPTCNI